MWAITGLFGPASVDRHFDEEFAFGSTGFGGTGNDSVQLQRIELFDLDDPLGMPADLSPDARWRCRSRGFAIAPFLIIDEAAWHDHILSGFAGKRLVFWFFGFSRWMPLRTYWVS